MQKKYGLNELREMFLAFFESKGHLRLPSFSLIPQNDPSLLLINSGMAPMKPYFTGEQEPPRRRVCTCQKCIRTGDIENIGKTARHGTYFEMLGNFSFGDYFKHEAIAWCWEFLTSPDWVGLDPERLYPSIYLDDDEAFEIWNKEIGIPENRIFRFGKADNFWEHGSGPCGPCSEVYYDRGEAYGCGKPDCTVGCDCDRFMEVWNNVFSQFNNDGNNNYTELAQKNIDTGMGLERLAVVCQDVNSLFDVDTVMNITNEVTKLTGAAYGQSQKMDVSLRVITDHIRASTMMICDGVLPSNEGRGYVLRRLLRRAARHGKLLGVNEPFLYKVVDMVIHENEGAYPDLRDKQGYITKVIHEEEKSFAKTIDGGMKIFAEVLAAHKAAGETVISGADAFRLHDTYGFPLDLTMDMAEENGMTVDEEGFRAKMEAQRQAARDALGDGKDAWKGLDLGLDNTPTAFSGYETLEDKGTILALVLGGEVTNEISTGADAILVLDKTPFYAEMGGQCADHGIIRLGDNVFEVSDVQKNKGEKYLHHGKMIAGGFRVGDVVETCVDAERRQSIMRAHSATHLLHKALSTVLGDHVHQAGSLVEPDRLRFDFTHFSAMTEEEKKQVETIANDAILAGYAIQTKVMGREEAKSSGATALFGEKYGEEVRVVNMGDFSSELCGGTHLDNTAKAGSVRIVSEYSVASGVRRIEAVTGKETLCRAHADEQVLAAVAARLKTAPAEIEKKLAQLLDEQKETRRQIEKLQQAAANADAERFLFSARSVGSLKVVTATVKPMGKDELRKMGDYLKEKDAAIVAVLATVQDEKITLNAVCGADAVKAGVRAGDIIKAIAPVIGGKGGGKPDSAMGGGSDATKLDNALAMVDDLVNEVLNK